METEFLIQSLGRNLIINISFIKIDNLPLLVLTIGVLLDTNRLTFQVFAVGDIKYQVVSPVDDLTLLVLEHLVPFWSGIPYLHLKLGLLAIIRDLPRLVVVSCSDSHRLLMEVKHLSLS